MYSPLVVLFSAFNLLLVTSGQEIWKQEQCQNFYPDVPYNANLLPSEIPEMSCKCTGLSGQQTCPKWQFLTGQENASDVSNPVLNENPRTCTSFLTFRVRPDLINPPFYYNFTLQCQAADNVKRVTLIIKKSSDGQKCNDDQDCLLKSQKCVVQGQCHGKMCAKACHCVHPTPVYVSESPDICYPNSTFDEPCNYTIQCHSGEKNGMLCSSLVNAANGSLGVCRCPLGNFYSDKHEACMVNEQEPPKQALTERIMIALCCGIVGIFIFVFLTYICKRHFRSSRRRQNDHDRNEEEPTSQPLKEPMQEKPPSYQESQEEEEHRPDEPPQDSFPTDFYPESNSATLPIGTAPPYHDLTVEIPADHDHSVEMADDHESPKPHETDF